MTVAKIGLSAAVTAILLMLNLAQAQSPPKNECAMAAFTRYTMAKLALLQRKDAIPIPSVEVITDQRRLQEQFCLQFAQCIFPAQTEIW